MKRRKLQEAALTNRTTLRVRFSEVDSMEVVWHGEYVRYMEDGREAFGRQYGIGYTDIRDAGYVVPIVELDVQYKQFLKYGESAIVETRYIRTDAAKILFEYVIFRESDETVVATGSSIQVFVNKATGLLELNNPDFYKKWKEKWKIR
ncbi:MULTISPECIES: acyl-CoA thioesterase [Parabacteroides]|uniref:acyl-CoA thioesterase n=1 Tax=Parabacteroides leei TaxID=2939491 RepID=UPI001899820E|nr:MULTISPECIES: acyl-CoA thioesterase [Parabacteroides]MCL3851534.1 acyl-CoA thioesterase [Parabacteroides leei]